MIPVRLELTNFLAYRNPAALDFEGIHLACLAGPNGAGKSSLLDAMTWSLWGRARTNRDDDLIHSGMNEMEVAFTFALDGNLYKVRRARQRSTGNRSGPGSLDFQIQDGEKWRGIAESGIRETQNKINRLLRLDYETFINSVFLLQGRADEFTVKKPSDRKKILADILGLSVWEHFEERAKEKVKELKTQDDQLIGELGTIDRELAREEEFRAQFTAAQSEALRLSETLREVESQAREVEGQRNELEGWQRQRADLERRIGQAEGEYDSLARQHEDAEMRLAGFDELLAEQADIEHGYAQLVAARESESALGGKLMEQTDLREQASALEAEITAERNKLETDQQVIGNKIEGQQRIIQEAEAEGGGALAQVREEVSALAEREGERDALREQLAAFSEERAGLESDNRALRKQMDVLDGQLAQVQASSATCPLCDQPLDDQHRAELVERFTQEGNQHGETFRANQERIDALGEDTATLRSDIASVEGALHKLPALRNHLTRLEERNERAIKAEAELQELDTRLAAVEQQLAANDYAAEAQAALAEVSAELAGLGYDQTAHHAARDTVREYEHYDARHSDLQHALAERPQVETALADLAERLAGWESTLTEDRTQLEALAEAIVVREEELVEAGQVERELARIQDEEAGARERLGAAQQRLDTLDTLRERREDLLARQDELLAERSIYEELRTAFSKNGIPAMIIDAAIPELQETANALLSRMTDGRMHLLLSTQREKVTGGVAETLDILISDGQSTRDYETFSGGEAMRINFALRIALSKLLARRAGAQLRTLVVDEGFGSQDAEGRERLMEAIQSVREDFDLILVITHLDELMDRFPARIEVTRTSNGSEIAVF